MLVTPSGSVPVLGPSPRADWPMVVPLPREVVRLSHGDGRLRRWLGALSTSAKRESAGYTRGTGSLPPAAPRSWGSGEGVTQGSDVTQVQIDGGGGRPRRGKICRLISSRNNSQWNSSKVAASDLGRPFHTVPRAPKRALERTPRRSGPPTNFRFEGRAGTAGTLPLGPLRRLPERTRIGVGRTIGGPLHRSRRPREYPRRAFRRSASLR